DIANHDVLGPLRDSGCRFVRPIQARVGDLGLDGFDALLFACTLRHSEGIFVSTRQMGTAIDDAIRAGNLGKQPQVNAYFCLSRWLFGIGNLTLKIHVPSAPHILGEAPSLGDALNWSGPPQAEAMPAVRGCVVLELDIRCFERNPAE